MWVSTERSYRLIQTPFKSAQNVNVMRENNHLKPQTQFLKTQTQGLRMNKDLLVKLREGMLSNDIVIK